MISMVVVEKQRLGVGKKISNEKRIRLDKIRSNKANKCKLRDIVVVLIAVRVSLQSVNAYQYKRSQ